MGNVFKFGDNIDTDVIVPGKYLNASDPEELAKVCMEGCKPGFAQNIKQGDIFVAGKNFGCGSSRQHAPISIKWAGVSCIIAESFGRIFYRNAINIGLPVLESPDAARSIEPDDIVYVDLSKGVVVNETKKETYNFVPFPPTVMKIIKAGGMNKEYFNNK
ncbi:MAG: 3-isopropylmalate dehydratase small subunit [Clostridiaceae bacterium]|jgi:3-isopropylmalate/(R)-2-methylmalate dehydratase small subunit|nr:3-isopropylmalate dehydratase small subunit [Clostridiaceae bacterium]